MEDLDLKKCRSAKDNRTTISKCCHGRSLHTKDVKEGSVDDATTSISYMVLDETLKPGNPDLNESNPLIVGVHCNLKKVKECTFESGNKRSTQSSTESPLASKQTGENVDATEDASFSSLHGTVEGAGVSCTSALLRNDHSDGGVPCMGTLLTKEDCSSCESLQRHKRNSELFGDYECVVCFELMLDPTTLPCNHTYCRSCVAKYYKKCGKTECPICRGQWSEVPEVNTALKMEIWDRFYSTYSKRLREQTASELKTIQYLDSMNRDQAVKKAGVVAGIHFMPLPEFTQSNGVRLCFICMSVIMAIVILGLWFAIP